MSGSPASAPFHEADVVTPTPSTRTVAIIKTHALPHRFDIEHRILEASFEIVKERQMEFDTETEPDTLYEIFGEDAASLAEGPVWVYVLERRRAVEVWNTLIGDSNPDVARRTAPNTLRALYGISPQQNGLMGSSDAQTAELLISSLFASSPPFHTTELPDDVGSPSRYGSMRSVSSSVLSALRRTASDEGYTPSNPSTLGGSNGKANTNGKPLFRARALPPTHVNPDIHPRTTRAADLRAGVVVGKTPSAPRAPISKERLAKTFANVPGHKRTETIVVASTAPPAVAPRMTRAVALRLGQRPEPNTTRRRPSSFALDGKTNDDVAKKPFEGVPGHKRRETISVASVKAPAVAPRLNRSATLRAQKDAAPPSSFMFRTTSTAKSSGLSRSNSSSSLNKPSSRSNTSASVHAPIQRPALATRPVSVATARQASQTVDRNEPTKPPKPQTDIQAPTIAPRTNRSALLRAAKIENAVSGGIKASKTKPALRALVH